MKSSVKGDQEVAVDAALMKAMRGLASSVVLISTVNKSSEPRVMVATAVIPVSMEPPSMLICVNRSASSYSAFLDGMDFCINVLHTGQESLARFCIQAPNGTPRLQMGNWIMNESGVPYLADAQAAIVCIQDTRVAYGTHDIFVGKVSSVRIADKLDPLVYIDRQYGKASPLGTPC